jgi:hypothetical protein
MLCTWGCDRPCGPEWCSNDAMIQRCGFDGIEPGQTRSLQKAERLPSPVSVAP